MSARAEAKPYAGKFQYFDETGRVLMEGPCRLTAGPESCTVTPASGAPVEAARALRGARTLVEAREIARQIEAPRPVAIMAEALPTLERFAELRAGAPERLDEAGAREILRELKAVGGDLRAVRLALTGEERGPELWTVLTALGREAALERARRVEARG